MIAHRRKASTFPRITRTGAPDSQGFWSKSFLPGALAVVLILCLGIVEAFGSLVAEENRLGSRERGSEHAIERIEDTILGFAFFDDSAHSFDMPPVRLAFSSGLNFILQRWDAVPLQPVLYAIPVDPRIFWGADPSPPILPRSDSALSSLV